MLLNLSKWLRGYCSVSLLNGYFLSLPYLIAQERREGEEEKREEGRRGRREGGHYSEPYSRGISYISRLEFFCLGVLFSTSLFSHLLISELIHGCSIYTLFCNLILCYLFHCAACPSVIVREHFRVAPASLWHELTFADVRALCLQGVYVTGLMVNMAGSGIA